ncbi:hypothetical protein HBI56_044010 [Parastagonospora nodorum]|nr:hypothetical protein HBH56_057140 [Parastagonospora nodorum]KAH3931111.1 hypothetical protein HBH54_101070 [Parastagonospora nodorum]KAH3943895.1 hypothetical protein HBH53_168780 [Parastagonospora nodorum]KAH3965346.1 hypothetical protein HBH51_149630 [Parastagonospora nodorum]KAH3977552.1 hypothetical protein HBH52_110140 [Parastagonospora nodorum]
MIQSSTDQARAQNMSPFSFRKELHLSILSLVSWTESPRSVAVTEEPIDQGGPPKPFHIYLPAALPMSSPSSCR